MRIKMKRKSASFPKPIFYCAVCALLNFPTTRKKLEDTFFTVFFSLVRKERKGQKEEGIDSRLGDADTHALHMCQSLF